jgi:hypothetical protein
MPWPIASLVSFGIRPLQLGPGLLMRVRGPPRGCALWRRVDQDLHLTRQFRRKAEFLKFLAMYSPG